MDKCRQQCGRNQRVNNRPCYQSRNSCGYQDSMCGSCGDMYKMKQTKYCNESCQTEDCPGMNRDEIAGMPLAMAYVPWQRFGELYPECEAIYHGTLFCDLDLDFCGKRCE